MKLFIKILIAVLVVYLLVGLYCATKFALNYNKAENSVPNNFQTFMINVFMWSL